MVQGNRTVFILGAGASRTGGGPLMGDFLQRAEDLWRDGKVSPHQGSYKLVFAAIGKLQQVFAKSTLDINNIESVFAAFEMAPLLGRLADLTKKEVDKLVPAIRTLIVTTLERRIHFRLTKDGLLPPQPYDEFAKTVREIHERRDMQVSVLTFNYDVGLEHAIRTIGLEVDYCFLEEKPGIPVMKLHGSMNWARCADCGEVLRWDLGNYPPKHGPRSPPDGQGRPYQMTFRDHFGEMKHRCKDGPNEGGTAEREPVIVPPTWNKTEHHQALQPVWRRAAQHLSEAENIFVIGYSLPETDPFFRYLYSLGTISDTRLKRLWVFDPDGTGQVKGRFEGMLGRLAEQCSALHKSVWRRWRLASRHSAATSGVNFLTQLPLGRVRFPNLLAMMTCSRLAPPNVLPISSSLWPFPYTSAVSKKLTPRSKAASIARIDSASSVSPQPICIGPRVDGPPTAHPPKPISDTRKPVLPSVR